MTAILDELVSLLGLERIEENIFRGRSQDLGWGTVFGGQVLGQSLSAATQTVPPERIVHSLHGYFLRPGDVNRPVVYEVNRLRDGKSFTTRRVVGIQKGRAIFNLSASFQIEEPGLEHHDEMPAVTPPHNLLSEQALARAVISAIPRRLRDRALAETPIEIRPVNPSNPLRPRVRPPARMVWFKADGDLEDTPSLHRYLLAYASDFHMLATALQPHGVSFMTSGMQCASINHAMWFHRPFRMDEWLLHVMESPSTSGARGLIRGRIFDEAGRLVASTSQEGLIRKRE